MWYHVADGFTTLWWPVRGRDMLSCRNYGESFVRKNYRVDRGGTGLILEVLLNFSSSLQRASGTPLSCVEAKIKREQQ